MISGRNHSAWYSRIRGLSAQASAGRRATRARPGKQFRRINERSLPRSGNRRHNAQNEAFTYSMGPLNLYSAPPLKLVLVTVTS